ncbi:hypothetical protein L873DRAFT_1218574 [Choiromyces venosus 120613-1]|uniref:Transmembrane protein n=1 Tax=Choiromyces venosus 120613-1 TaxID=1336337 RepID=A0A3N4JH17_9PEZI|nr:hypothetical protein L873DRAFT_1218574 [Choiromyces venosus 120613-1]
MGGFFGSGGKMSFFVLFCRGERGVCGMGGLVYCFGGFCSRFWISRYVVVVVIVFGGMGWVEWASIVSILILTPPKINFFFPSSHSNYSSLLLLTPSRSQERGRSKNMVSNLPSNYNITFFHPNHKISCDPPSPQGL